MFNEYCFLAYVKETKEIKGVTNDLVFSPLFMQQTRQTGPFEQNLREFMGYKSLNLKSETMTSPSAKRIYCTKVTQNEAKKLGSRKSIIFHGKIKNKNPYFNIESVNMRRRCVCLPLICCTKKITYS